MSAPPVMRPLRAILQRRLQIVPSRPIRTHFHGRAPNSSSQLRFNSSIPPNQTSKPNEKATKDEAAKSEVTVEEAHSHTVSAKAEQIPDAQVKAKAASETVAISPKVPSDETASAAPIQPAARKLDEVFLRAAFTQVRVAGAEIQAEIEAVVALQLEAAAEADPAVQEVEKLAQEAQGAQEAAVARASVPEDIPAETAPQTILREEVLATDNITETPEPSLAEVAEAVLSETQTTTTSPTPAQETTQVDSSETEAVEVPSLETAIPEATKEVSLDSSGPQIIASGTASSAASTSNAESESVKPMEQETESETAADASVSDSTVSEFLANPERSASNASISKFAETMLDDIAAEAAAAEAASRFGQESARSQDAFLDAVLNERKEASKPREEPSKDTLSSAVDETLVSRNDEILKAAEQAEAATTGKAEPSRLPRNVQALYLQPLRRVAEYGVPSCDLQLRSYSVRPLESFCDFALRAAYYLGLPAYGPTPLPKIIERWTVPKSSFIFKKSQENFERITRRRLIQIRDGHPQTVQMWLAFLQKHQQAAVGMKANMWEFSSLDVAKEMDKAYEEAQQGVDKSLKFLGQTKSIETAEKVDEILQSERYRMAAGR